MKYFFRDVFLHEISLKITIFKENVDLEMTVQGGYLGKPRNFYTEPAFFFYSLFVKNAFIPLYSIKDTFFPARYAFKTCGFEECHIIINRNHFKTKPFPSFSFLSESSRKNPFRKQIIQICLLYFLNLIQSVILTGYHIQ